MCTRARNGDDPLKERKRKDKSRYYSDTCYIMKGSHRSYRLKKKKETSFSSPAKDNRKQINNPATDS